MKIEDVKVGMKVKLISTANTEEHLGYDEHMLSVGECGKVICVDNRDCSVLLSDNYWYSIKDLEHYLDTPQNYDKTNIGKLTVSVSLEDKQEIAKDILNIILEDLNTVITDATQSLSEVDCGEVGQGVIGESVLTAGKLDDDVLSNLLLLIDNAAENRDHQTVDVLTKAYQRIKSVQTI